MLKYFSERIPVTFVYAGIDVERAGLLMSLREPAVWQTPDAGGRRQVSTFVSRALSPDERSCPCR